MKIDYCDTCDTVLRDGYCPQCRKYQIEKKIKTYKVTLWEEGFDYKIKADNPEQAERLAIKQHNGGNDMIISKSKVVRLKNRL